MRYFDLFSLPVDYHVDLALLNSTYLQLQKAVHPDKFAHGTDKEKLLAIQKSAEINDALQTLKHPLKRAEYMLAERGIDIRAEQQTLQDPMFLMQQLELREVLEDIRVADDPDAAIENFESEIKTLNDGYHQALNKLINQLDTTHLENAADIVRKLKFVYKLSDELERIEDTLD